MSFFSRLELFPETCKTRNPTTLKSKALSLNMDVWKTSWCQRCFFVIIDIGNWRTRILTSGDLGSLLISLSPSKKFDRPRINWNLGFSKEDFKKMYSEDGLLG